jgi:hypothetical protein
LQERDIEEKRLLFLWDDLELQEDNTDDENSSEGSSDENSVEVPEPELLSEISTGKSEVIKNSKQKDGTLTPEFRKSGSNR